MTGRLSWFEDNCCLCYLVCDAHPDIILTYNIMLCLYYHGQYHGGHTFDVLHWHLPLPPSLSCCLVLHTDKGVSWHVLHLSLCHMYYINILEVDTWLRGNTKKSFQQHRHCTNLGTSDMREHTVTCLCLVRTRICHDTTMRQGQVSSWNITPTKHEPLSI